MTTKQILEINLQAANPPKTYTELEILREFAQTHNSIQTTTHAWQRLKSLNTTKEEKE